MSPATEKTTRQTSRPRQTSRARPGPRPRTGTGTGQWSKSEERRFSEALGEVGPGRWVEVSAHVGTR